MNNIKQKNTNGLRFTDLINFFTGKTNKILVKSIIRLIKFWERSEVDRKEKQKQKKRIQKNNKQKTKN